MAGWIRDNFSWKANIVMQKALVYIQLQNDLNPCFWHSLKKARENWDGDIILVAPQRELSWPAIKENNVRFVSEESLQSDLLDEYNKKTFFNRIHPGWNGFWDNACKRLIYLWMVQEHYHVDKIFHIETDVILYINLGNIFDGCEKHFKDKIVFSKHAPYQTSCCTIYSDNIHSTYLLCKSIVEYFDRGHEWFLNKYSSQTIINETHFAYTYCEENKDRVAYFATMPGDENSCVFNALIDPTAWGMWGDGLHRNPSQSFCTQYNHIGLELLQGK